MKAIEVRDFDVMVLHHDPSKGKQYLQEVFVIAHRMQWHNYPYILEYEPTLTAILTDPNINPSPDNEYENALIAVNGKGSFTIDAESRAVNEDDVYACVVQIGDKINEYLVSNKEKHGYPVFHPHPQLSSGLFDEVRNFLKKGFGNR